MKRNLGKKFEEKRKELENQKLGNKKLIEELENLQQQKIKDLEIELSKTETAVELELAKEKLALGNKHYKELNSAMKDYIGIDNDDSENDNLEDLEKELEKEQADRLAK